MRKTSASLCAVGASLPLASEGAIIYSGSLDLDVPNGPPFSFPLVANGFNGGTIEVQLVTTTLYPGAPRRANLVQQVSTNAPIRLIDGSGGYDVFVFKTLDVVRPGNSNSSRFGNAYSGWAYWELNFVGDEFPALQIRTIGFRTTESQHGWVRSELFLDQGGSTFRILDWAVETEPGKSITVFPIPEPSSTGLAALALGAAAVIRRRRKSCRADPAP